MRTRPSTLLEGVALIAILIVAAALRLGAPGVVEFKRDEANLSLMALDMARGRDFPLLGIDSSVGIRNAPVNVWIMALPYWFTSDPLLATQFVGLLNVGAVLLLYLLTRRYYGPLAAVIAGLLFAVSPWAVVYSRKIWAQDMLPIFIVATIATGLVGFAEGRRWAQWWHLPLLAITGQIHYVTFVLIPITVYLLIVGRRRLTRAFLMSLLLTVLVTLPYVIGIVRESQRNPETFRRIATQGVRANTDEAAAPLTVTGTAFEYAWFTVNGANLHSITGPTQFERYLASVPQADQLLAVFGVALVLAAAWLALRSLARRGRDERTPSDVVLLLWLLVTPLAFSLTWVPVYPHYMIPILPAAFAILGAGASDGWRGLQRMAPPAARLLVGGLGVAGVATVVIIHVWLKVALLDFVALYHTSDGFGTPLGLLNRVRDAILADHPTSILVNLDGQFIGYNDETTVWNFLLYEVPERRFLDEATEVYPAEPTLYLSHRCRSGVEYYTLRQPAEGCLALELRAPGHYGAKAFTGIPTAGKQRFANGARLIGHDWQPDAGCLRVAWTTTHGPVLPDYSMAVHFLNAQGEKILDADGLTLRGQYWRAGDIVTRAFCLKWGHERIGEITGVRLGFYTATQMPDGMQFDNVPMIDANGAIIGQMVEVQFN
jgi:4-amino-4-deoxy-L-arabinose transferase-like glycosyltransferase